VSREFRKKEKSSEKEVSRQRKNR